MGVGIDQARKDDRTAEVLNSPALMLAYANNQIVLDVDDAAWNGMLSDRQHPFGPIPDHRDVRSFFSPALRAAY